MRNMKRIYYQSKNPAIAFCVHLQRAPKTRNTRLKTKSKMYEVEKTANAVAFGWAGAVIKKG